MTVKTPYQPGQPIWIDLGTPDVSATAAFYGSLFGWTASEGREEFGGYANFSLDGRQVAGVMPLMTPDQPPVWTCYVCTDDADKTAALVAEAGGSTLAPPMAVHDLGRMAVFADPTGAVFGVWEPGRHIGAELVDDEGTLTWIELSTRDQPAALAFYATVFGWEDRPSPGYTEFAQGSASVAGCMDMPEMVPAQVPSYWMPYFAASDPAAKAEQVASLGGTVLMPSMEFAGGTFSVVQDPNGATFGLLALRRE
ncbi:MAG: Glyoxalase/bleomycin resistance protein/dioxygenase [Frankiales bacterium]|nr:Glyoxalase/bleomycin resistance protein/dioxygenase [Frankiales bacterium]